MSTPDPAHIDAVARAIDSNHHPYGIGTPEWDERARRLLDSQNPAVHAAMLDALTRHGVLTEEVRKRLDGFAGQWVGEGGAITGTYRAPSSERRLVTSWEVTP